MISRVDPTGVVKTLCDPVKATGFVVLPLTLLRGFARAREGGT